jgi:hypothetical protein
MCCHHRGEGGTSYISASILAPKSKYGPSATVMIGEFKNAFCILPIELMKKYTPEQSQFV